MEKIRLLLADDHTLVRQGLRNILESEPDLEIVGEAADGQQAVELATELLPDVVLTDIRMGEWDGVSATRRIRAAVPSARVIVLTNYDEDELVFASIRAGASGYLLKEVQSQQLIDAVRHVAQGYTLVYPSVAKRVLDEFGQPKTPSASSAGRFDEELADLTPRERQILRLIAHGRSNKDIAATLGITERTVKTHVSNIFAKLQLSDRTQAALYAHRKGLGE
ncbi:MAG TPA: response regulator transcription factor [Candidatus Dormibacteraeota bacterium]|jgi:NarL family two-component system response regulator LiaR|nr:response regulator transcription factor [Candidatus Dormibacteraeota bacterium]